MKTKNSILILLLAATSFLFNGDVLQAQSWTPSSPNIYFTGGYVGIGTTGPGNALDIISPYIASTAWKSGLRLNKLKNPTSPNGSVLTVDSTGDVILVKADGNDWHIKGNTGTTASTAAIGSQVNNNFIGTNDATDWVMATDSLERMRITSGGNVGIGTASPDVYSFGSAHKVVTIAGTSTANSMGVIDLVGGTTGRGVINFGTVAIRQGAITSLNTSDLTFANNTSNTGMTITEKMRILANGNVGIGTTSPDISANGSAFKTLTVLGPNTSALSCGILELATQSTDADANLAGAVVFTASTNASLKKSIAQITAWTQGTTSTNRGGLLTFTTKPDGSTSTVERMRIDNAGNVGIGNTSPGYKLDVTGDIHNTGVMAVGMAPSGSYTLSINGSGLAFGGSWVPSDQQFKTNIDSLQNAIAIIKQLKPKTYYFDTANVYGLNFSNKKQYGFIAQELEQVLPDLVKTGTKQADVDTLGNIIHPALTFKTLDYLELIAFLTKGVQEQEEKIDNLNTKVANQDSINTALVKKDSINEAQLQTMENQINQKDLLNATMFQMMQNQINQLDSMINSCCSLGSTKSMQLNSDSQISDSQVINSKDVELVNRQVVVLFQNSPNPFKEQTSIEYYLPDNVQRAQIIFMEQSGKLIKTVDLTEKGKGVLNVFSNDLTNGTYLYSLIIDGQTIETKKMVKTK